MIAKRELTITWKTHSRILTVKSYKSVKFKWNTTISKFVYNVNFTYLYQSYFNLP